MLEEQHCINELNFHDKNYHGLSQGEAQAFPYNCVGALYENPEFPAALGGDNYSFGTGFLIASDLVLTVAHNVYSKNGKVNFAHLVFYPGVSGQLKDSTGYKVVDFRYPKEYTFEE